MSTMNDNEKSTESREVRAAPLEAETSETDSQRPADPTEFADTAEKGYGWGV